MHSHGYDVIDLGDDIYTQGKPHPMIDPEVRIQKIESMQRMNKQELFLFDVVLGYGAHEDMVESIATCHRSSTNKS